MVRALLPTRLFIGSEWPDSDIIPVFGLLLARNKEKANRLSWIELHAGVCRLPRIRRDLRRILSSRDPSLVDRTNAEIFPVTRSA